MYSVPRSNGDSSEFYTCGQFGEEEQRSWKKRRKTNVLEIKRRVFFRWVEDFNSGTRS